MIRWVWKVVCLAAICCIAAAAEPVGAQTIHGKKKLETVWSGTAGSFRWKWTTQDLTAASAGTGRTVFSALAFEKRTSTLLKDEKEDPVDNYVECSVLPLSVVGSIACYERDYYWEGGAHPSGSIDFLAIDAASSNRKLLLTDLFPDADVLEALLSDKIIRDTLKRNNVKGTPRNCAQLVKLLAGKSFGGDENGQFGFQDDFLQRFAFHHVEGNKVAVRLNVSWNYEIYRFSSTQIGILLPIPARLRTALENADSRRQGFLMRDAMKIAGGRDTVLFTMGKTP
jgi:hypothetical protein